MKDFIVTFGPNGARIVKGINPADWVNHPNCLVNPDLSKVRGIPPHLWRIDGAQVVAGANTTPPSLVPAGARAHWTFWAKVAALSLLVSCIVRFL